MEVSDSYPLCPLTRSCAPAWSEVVLLSYHAAASSDAVTLTRHFLHTTWLGAALVYWFWRALAMYSVKTIIPNLTKVFTTNYSFTFWVSRATPHFVVLLPYFGTHAQTTKGSLPRGVFTRLRFRVQYLSLRPREWQNSEMTGAR